MVSSSPLTISQSDLRQDRLRWSSKPELLLGFVATLSIVVDGRVWYEESEFPILEFADAVKGWLSQPAPDRGDFVYTSLESEVEGLIAFRGRNGQWRLESPHALFQSERAFDATDIEPPLRHFVSAVWEQARAVSGKDLETSFS